MKNSENRAWDIHGIEALTEREAQALALETMTIKGHSIYFVDFGGYFKYSALVFAEGKHIYHANDYELHHTSLNGNHEALKTRYIETLNKKLWTEEELTGPLHNYTEYQAKEYYLHNLYPQRRDHISIWFYGSEEERAARQEKIKSMIFCPFTSAFFLPEDRDFVSRMETLYHGLHAARNAMENDPEYLKIAILCEMYNHEYGINWQGNWDVLGCFGFIKYNENDNPEPYFDQLKWPQAKRAAFWAARSQYYKEQREREEREDAAC